MEEREWLNRLLAIIREVRNSGYGKVEIIIQNHEIIDLVMSKRERLNGKTEASGSSDWAGKTETIDTR